MQSSEQCPHRHMICLLGIHLQHLSLCLVDSAPYPLLFAQAGQVLGYWVRGLTEQHAELWTVLWATVATHIPADVHIWLEFLPFGRIKSSWRHKVTLEYITQTKLPLEFLEITTTLVPFRRFLWSLTEISESQWLLKAVFPRDAYVPPYSSGKFVQYSVVG